MGPILTDEQLDRALLDHFVERRAEIVAAAPSSHEVASRIDARAVPHARVDTYGFRLELA